MSLFSRLVLLALLILGGILAWDLGQERLVWPGKKLIIYASMFSPGEPMQQLYAGPAPATVSRQPFGAHDLDHYDALMRAWPAHRERLRADYRAAHGRSYPADLPADPPGDRVRRLAAEYADLKAGYVERLVTALGQSDRANRLKLFGEFAEAHPHLDRLARVPVTPSTGPQTQPPEEPAFTGLIPTFERLHPAWTVGLFEDFERRHPDHKIIPRWDGRWVLSANRPRFLTGSDVPDLISGGNSELRILMRENLAVPLDQPLPDAENPRWRSEGILAGEAAYGRPDDTFESQFYDWALDRSRYTVTDEDVRDSGNPFPAGQRVLYFLPRQVHTFVIFYNKAHFELIGRDPDDTPRTVEEFEAICRQVKAAGKWPIANDGVSYINYWWDWMVYRQIGNDQYVATVTNQPGAGRFAGPQADPRYLEIAQRLRRWRDEGFWMEDFSASKWPAAQGLFGTGRCTFLFTGSWLPAEIASTQSTDPAVFRSGCFFFPKVAGGTGDADAIQVAPQGYCLCRQGKNPEGAVLLLRYLTAHGTEPLARKLGYISTTRDAPFPPSLADIGPIMSRARSEDFLGDGPGWYAPKFAKFVLNETYPRFFLVRKKDELNPAGFVGELERRAQNHYREYGGQAR